MKLLAYILKPGRLAIIFIIVFFIIYISFLLTIDSHVIKSIFNAESLKEISLKQPAKNLVVFNAIGKRNNIPLIEHARKRVFTPDKWDCIAHMVSKEDTVPDDDPHLRALIDELDCSVPRTPALYWGDLLQFITPTLVSKYEYIALVLDDMFIPHEGERAFDANLFVERMKKYNIGVMQPAVDNDTWNTIAVSKNFGVNGCIAEVPFIETYLEVFSRDAWKCFYSNLHYIGSRGWCYDLCFKKTCSEFVTAQDFTMITYHMDQLKVTLPYNDKTVVIPEDLAWSKGDKLQQGYLNLDMYGICKRCDVKFFFPKGPMTKIYCPNDAINEKGIK